MDFDRDKVDDATLALMRLVMWMEDPRFLARAWKGFDWDTLDRLYQKGMIDNPKGKARSVVVTEEGEKRAGELFQKLFGVAENQVGRSQED